MQSSCITGTQFPILISTLRTNLSSTGNLLEPSMPTHSWPSFMQHAIVTQHLQSQGLPVKPLRYTISTLVKFTRTPIPIISASSPSSPTSRNSELADSTRLPIQMARYGILLYPFPPASPAAWLVMCSSHTYLAPGLTKLVPMKVFHGLQPVQ